MENSCMRVCIGASRAVEGHHYFTVGGITSQVGGAGMMLVG